MKSYLLLLAACLTLAPLTPSRAAEVNGAVSFKGGALQNAVVWIDVPNPPKVSAKKTPVMDQRNLSFLPRVLAVRVGDSVDFPNHDRVFHNVFSLRDGKKFDLGLYPVGARKRVKFDKPGLCRLFCNIHPNMAAYIMVVDTPFHAVTDGKGRFSIPGVPDGAYTYHAWKPGGKTLDGKVTVGGGKPLEIRLP
jgi:plastocyanin